MAKTIHLNIQKIKWNVQADGIFGGVGQKPVSKAISCLVIIPPLVISKSQSEFNLVTYHYLNILLTYLEQIQVFLNHVLIHF